MATPYSEIYERALFKVRDIKLAELGEGQRQYVLKNFLYSAISDFSNKCKKDLEARDDIQEEFAEDLTNEEKEILALGIAYYWLSAQVMNRELLRNKLSTKDYTYFSPANLMREVNEFRSDVRKEYKHRITNYTYDHGDLDLDGEV